MITINDIKEQYIEPILSQLPYIFQVYTDLGDYERATRENNIRHSTINGVMTVTESDISLLGGGLKASAVNMSLRFLIPVPDEAFDEEGGYSGDYTFVEEFRERLASVVATSEKITLTDADGNSYVGAVSSGFPMSGELAQRQIIGYSFEYTCYLQFAYLKNAVNASDALFYLDGDTTPLPITGFAIGRNSTLTANLLSSSTNGESGVFAENSVFTVDVTLPVINPSSSTAAQNIYDYLMGVDDMNEEHTLQVIYAGKTTTLSVIIAKTVDSGEGAANVTRQLSFAPLIMAEDDDDESGEAV